MAEISFSSDGFEPFALVLDRFRQNITDAEPVMVEMATFQKETVNARQFAAEGSAETGRWSPLSPPYKRYKDRVRPGRPILVFNGDLKQEMTSTKHGIYETWGTGFTVGTGNPVGGYHQRGTPFMPARRILGSPRRADVARMTKMLQRWIVERRTS